MLKKLRDAFDAFYPSQLVPHPDFPFYNTIESLHPWRFPFTVELPRLRISVAAIDYLESPPSSMEKEAASPEHPMLNFQQNTYRLWYQIDGFGVLQNVTRKTFGTARPGLLGVMERGERHSYLHQRGRFACFQILFSFFPSVQSKCYWNSEVEGKTILDESDRLWFENTVFESLRHLHTQEPFPEIPVSSVLLSMLSQLFINNLICIEESRFPRNKAKSLVNKAITFINLHYQSLHHQEALEKECHVDINYLNILFKKETGATLYHYLSSVRMEHAKHLLATTAESVGDIAKMTGYPNSNSFSRAFKRLERCTPLEFRSKNSKTIQSK